MVSLQTSCKEDGYNTYNMTSTENADLNASLWERIRQLEAIEHEYLQIKKLLDDAAHGEHMDKLSNNIVLYTQPENRKIIDANPRALEFLGYTQEAIFATSIDRLEVESSQQEVSVYIESSIQVYEYDCLFWHREGHQLSVHVRKWLVEKEGQGIICYTLVDKSLRTQLWHELSRREDSDYQFREKLKVLNEIAIKLGQLSTFHDICFYGVKLGIEKLGFDRISLWFLNRAKTLMMGTYGVDEEGNIRDEWDISWSYLDTYTEDFVNGRREPFITHDSAPLYNEKSETVGYGWHVSVPMLNRGEFVGFIGADNFINRQPLKNYQPELMRLFGATIGHLVARQKEQETIHKLSSAIEHSSSMILVLSKSQEIEFANDAFCQVSGYTMEETLGKSITMLFKGKNLKMIQSAISSGESWQGELVNQRKDGQYYETIISVSPVQPGASIEYYVIVQEDISMLKQVQQNELALQLEQERARLLETFVTDISHEFKTPLAVINTSSFILSKSDDPEKRATHSDMVKIQVNNLDQMLDDILEIVKITSALDLEKEPIRLADFVREIVDSFLFANNGKHLEWQIDLDSAIVVEADTQKLARIVHEILGNAVQFTPANGTISVSLHVDKKQVGIRIEDTGLGIAAEEIGKIFDRFYRVDKARSTRNTGLGLSIAKLLVDAHHGQINVESELGKGSCFEILLPL